MKLRLRNLSLIHIYSREDAALDVVQQAQALNPGGRFVALHADVSDSAQVNADVYKRQP